VQALASCFKRFAERLGKHADGYRTEEMNTLMHGTKQIADLTFNNNVADLIKLLEELVEYTPEKDASIVNIEIAPAIDYQGGTAYKEGHAVLFEESLSDGSKVYNIEVY
jgi:hypothetical protein